MIEATIDKNYLLGIAGDDKDFMRNIVSDFKTESLELLENLRKEVAKMIDLDKARSLIHQFKGSSASLGMVSLSERLYEMELWSADDWSSDFDFSLLLGLLLHSVELCLQVLA